MEPSKVSTYAVLMRPIHGAIHTMYIQAETEFCARQMALALCPDQLVIKVYPVSNRDA